MYIIDVTINFESIIVIIKTSNDEIQEFRADVYLLSQLNDCHREVYTIATLTLIILIKQHVAIAWIYGYHDLWFNLMTI